MALRIQRLESFQSGIRGTLLRPCGVHVRCGAPSDRQGQLEVLANILAKGVTALMLRSAALARMFARKPFDSLQREACNAGLVRSLGPVQLVLLGIGCILGAGIYVMPGNAAANFAGPAVVLSFVIAGVACG